MHTESTVRDDETAPSASSSVDAAIQAFGLSPRELDVVRGYIDGLGPTEIADRYGLSPKTVATYRFRIFEKLPVKNSTQLGIWAERVGLAAAVELDGRR